MTEDEAKAWIATHFGRSAIATMQSIVDAVLEESAHQNLIAPSTLPSIWARHIVDSAQLLTLIGPITAQDMWIDIGSGAGFPGLVIGALGANRVLLVEPRRRRAEFLGKVIDSLGIGAQTRIVCGKIESVTERATIVSARAVGYLGDILDWSARCADKDTRWILPKGQSALDEVETVRKMWHGTFHVEHSVTDPLSLIVLASGVARR